MHLKDVMGLYETRAGWHLPDFRMGRTLPFFRDICTSSAVQDILKRLISRPLNPRCARCAWVVPSEPGEEDRRHPWMIAGSSSFMVRGASRLFSSISRTCLVFEECADSITLCIVSQEQYYSATSISLQCLYIASSRKEYNCCGWILASR